MFYKEWRAVRGKFVLMLVLYWLAALPTITILSPYRGEIIFPPGVDWTMIPSLFGRWTGVGGFITLLVALVAGIDSVADEADHGTLSFLLTRPISRSRIFLTKAGLNCVAVACSCILGSLPVLIADQRNPVARIGQDVKWLGLVVCLGIAATCITAFISTITHSLLQTIPFALIVNIVIFFSLVQMTQRYLFYHNGMQYIAQADPWSASGVWLLNNIPTILGVSGVLTIGCLGAGLITFRRKVY